PPELVGWTARELRTPLEAARASLKSLERQVAPASATAEAGHLLGIAQQLDEMEQVIEAMADASRMAQGQLEVASTRVVLQEIAREVVSHWRERAPEYRLDLEAPREEVAVRGDRQRLAQAIGLLVSNAVRHGAPPRHARVEIDATESAAELRVRELGPGLTRATDEKLWQGAMGAPRAAPGVAGTGLGLFLAIELIRLHGGTLRARSQPGGGTAFTVTLARAP
ncbi:MAG TPA: HAMP domain-containing sensor histidine kinase, partial [Myxococcaceae bacterium]|nr:HAMP domain-containing sensor histidine kinase [Myxococcaceae bacterium]